MSSEPRLKIGSEVWWFDENRRIYPKEGEPGFERLGSAPIWREHWRKMEIIGENRVSWIVGFAGGKVEQFKIKKKDLYPRERTLAYSEADIDEREWLEKHRHRIAEVVGRIKNPRVLRMIATFIDYKDTP